MEAIIVNNLTRTYKKKKNRVNAIKDISMKFSYGKMYLIVGHSGSGKSTLLRILGLIDKPDSGQIIISGNNVMNLKNKELANLRNNEIGFIFQNFLLDKYLTAKENVAIPMLINKKYKSRKEIDNLSSTLLKNVSLDKRENHFPKELSGGEQQRVAIARALANNPKIILADEPTGNLDVENEQYIFKELKKMSNDGKCIIMVSHSKDAVKYADVVLELKDGCINE